MALKAAFVFLSPSADPNVHRQTVVTPEVELTTVAAKSYAQAVAVCQDLVASGIAAIELCGGFGYAGASAIAAAVGDGAAVGVVRFDNHPGLGFKSGDALFGE